MLQTLAKGLENSWTSRLRGRGQWHGGWLAAADSLWDQLWHCSVASSVTLMMRPNSPTANFEAILNLTWWSLEFQSRRALRSLDIKKPYQLEQKFLSLGHCSPPHQSVNQVAVEQPCWKQPRHCQWTLCWICTNSVKLTSSWATWGSLWQTQGDKLLFLSALSIGQAVLILYSVWVLFVQMLQNWREASRRLDQDVKGSRLQIKQGQVREAAFSRLEN